MKPKKPNSTIPVVALNTLAVVAIGFLSGCAYPISCACGKRITEPLNVPELRTDLAPDSSTPGKVWIIARSDTRVPDADDRAGTGIEERKPQ